MTNPSEQVRAIREKLNGNTLILERWGKAPEIIAVTKTVPPERINLLSESGIARLGENRVQEFIEKRPMIDAAFSVDIIGRMQLNKVKTIIDKAAMVQSVDRMELAQEIDRRAKQHNLIMPVLIEVNIGREPQKGGVLEEDLHALVKAVCALGGMQLRGLMTVMPDLDDKEALRPLFARMRQLFDQLRDEVPAGAEVDELSMGMSGDYMIAAEEGATHLRLGSAIFGKRAPAGNAVGSDIGA